MDKTTTTLIIVIIILIGVLGLAGGFILQGYLVKNNNSTINQTNTSLNATNNTTKSNSESSGQSGFISEGEAINIALSNVNINEEYIYGAMFIPDQGGPNAHYIVGFESVKTGKGIVGVTIDARTGAITGINYD